MNKRKKVLIKLLIFTIINSFSLVSQTLPDYDRKDWKHWVDLDRDCQNTRDEILVRDGKRIKFKKTTTRKTKCKVKKGTWVDPYTTVKFDSPRKIDIDHIVPLGHAHIAGGFRWNEEEKKQFANDVENLIAVSSSANRSKGAKAPDKWVPENDEFLCEYAQQWMYIKDKYNLRIFKKEQKTLDELLELCD